MRLVDKAILKIGGNTNEIIAEFADSSATTVKRFRRRERIYKTTFIAICRVLQLNPNEIAEELIDELELDNIVSPQDIDLAVFKNLENVNDNSADSPAGIDNNLSSIEEGEIGERLEWSEESRRIERPSVDLRFNLILQSHNFTDLYLRQFLVGYSHLEFGEASEIDSEKIELDQSFIVLLKQFLSNTDDMGINSLAITGAHEILARVYFRNSRFQEAKFHQYRALSLRLEQSNVEGRKTVQAAKFLSDILLALGQSELAARYLMSLQRPSQDLYGLNSDVFREIMKSAVDASRQ